MGFTCSVLVPRGPRPRETRRLALLRASKRTQWTADFWKSPARLDEAEIPSRWVFILPCAIAPPSGSCRTVS